LALGERLGNVPTRSVAADCVWIHAVSLGEINATRSIVTELKRQRPTLAIAISSTTQTGLARARELYGAEHTVLRFPLDFSWALQRVFDRVRPSALVLMELEVWPNLTEVAARAGVPILVANGRVTEGKSMRRFQQPVIRGVARRMFQGLRWVGAQEETYAERFRRLGVPAERIDVVGSLKFDTANVTDRVDRQDELAQEMGIDPQKPLLVAGGTGPEEEGQVLDAYAGVLARHPELQLAIVPRKPERFDDVAGLIVRRGFTCLRRSTGEPMQPSGVAEPRAVFLGDTMGELRKFYGLATVAFVGRSLVPMGGSDMIEAAALAKPVVVGPHTFNFSEAVRVLKDGGGLLEVQSAQELAEMVGQMLERPAEARAVGKAGRAAVIGQQGATKRTVERILTFLPG
jgi:3-deoxy-D-manno-octulosonic-acid transferase